MSVSFGICAVSSECPYSSRAVAQKQAEGTVSMKTVVLHELWLQTRVGAVDLLMMDSKLLYQNV